jgi:hypothetical protein
MKHVNAKFVLHILTEGKMTLHFIQCSVSDLTLLPKVITGDKSWVYGYDLKMRTQSSQWKTPTSPILKKAHQSRMHAKVLLIDCVL